MLTAKLAHCVTRRHGVTGYLARVRLYGRIGHVGAFLGMGDTLAEAEGDAIRYMRDQMRRESLAAPEPVNIGKLPRVKFESESFA